MVDLIIVICNRVADASNTTYRAVGMFIITNNVAETPIIALGMSIIPDGSIIPSRAGGTPIESWISAEGRKRRAQFAPLGYGEHHPVTVVRHFVQPVGACGHLVRFDGQRKRVQHCVSRATA